VLLAGNQPLYQQEYSIAAMAMTAKDMNPKYKETSEAGLAALVLC
jgi:L-serine deaminase